MPWPQHLLDKYPRLAAAERELKRVKMIWGQGVRRERQRVRRRDQEGARAARGDRGASEEKEGRAGGREGWCRDRDEKRTTSMTLLVDLSCCHATTCSSSSSPHVSTVNRLASLVVPKVPESSIGLQSLHPWVHFSSAPSDREHSDPQTLQTRVEHSVARLLLTRGTAGSRATASAFRVQRSSETE